MFIYTPYVYLIGWSSLDRYYIGSRYKKDVAHPSDLWTTYFTSSSSIIVPFVKKHGDPDIIIVLKTFSNRNDTFEYETTILRRLDARNHPKLLNGHNNDGLYVNKEFRSSDAKRKTSKTVKNLKWYHNGAESIRIPLESKIPEGYVPGRVSNGHLGLRRSEQFRQKMSKIAKTRTYSPRKPATRKKISASKLGKKMFNNGCDNKYFSPDKVPEGFTLGRIGR